MHQTSQSPMSLVKNVRPLRKVESLQLIHAFYNVVHWRPTPVVRSFIDTKCKNDNYLYDFVELFCGENSQTIGPSVLSLSFFNKIGIIKDELTKRGNHKTRRMQTIVCFKGDESTFDRCCRYQI